MEKLEPSESVAGEPETPARAPRRARRGRFPLAITPAAFGIADLKWSPMLRIPRSVLAASVAINLLGLALPLAILQVYDRIVPNKALETLAMLMLGLASVMVIEAVLRIARSFISGWGGAQFAHGSGIDALQRILYAPTKAKLHEPSNKLLERFNAISTIGDYFGGPSRLLLVDLPFVVLFLTVMALVGGIIVLVPLAVISVFGSVAYLRGLAMKQTLEARAEQETKNYDFIIECLSGIATVKSMSMEPAMLRRFERLQEDTAQINFRAIDAAGRAQILSAMLGTTSMVMMVSFGGILAAYGGLTIGKLACCTLLSGRMIQPLLRTIGIWNEFQAINVARNEMTALFDLPEPKIGDGYASDRLTGSIRIDNLCHNTAGAVDDPLLNVSLNVAPGEFVAFRSGVGNSGSALLEIISGEQIPESGSVTIDGYDIADNHDLIGAAVVFVAQQSALFRGTILENLTLFGHGPSVDDARWATRLIGLEKEINKLPDGYDTSVGEGVTETLSGGFQQLIAIARALARRPKVLLLDEPQAMLDSGADRMLLAGLASLRGEMTILVNSRRPSYAAVACRGFAFNSGRLVPLEAEAEALASKVSA